jgi:uncharacterized damage-inducible protein DinB
MNRDIIEQYANGGEKLSMAIRGLTADDLLQAPVPGKWSTQQVIMHLADAEAAFAERIKRIIAMDDPVLPAWDETRFSDRLHYNDQSVEDAVQLIDLTRRQLARVLRKLPDQAFQRIGQHSQRGRQTLLDVINAAIQHLDHHLKFVYEKREKLGKLMW